jgi:hypothetical protein
MELSFFRFLLAYTRSGCTRRGESPSTVWKKELPLMAVAFTGVTPTTSFKIPR